MFDLVLTATTNEEFMCIQIYYLWHDFHKSTLYIEFNRVSITIFSPIFSEQINTELLTEKLLKYSKKSKNIEMS